MAFQQPGKERLARVSVNLVTPKALILDRWAHCGDDGAKSLCLSVQSPGVPGSHFPPEDRSVVPQRAQAACPIEACSLVPDRTPPSLGPQGSLAGPS